MNKTLELFKKYGLVEADEMDATDMAEQPPIQDPAEMTPEGEKYLVGLLLKAFLHVPDDSEGRIAKDITRFEVHGEDGQKHYHTADMGEYEEFDGRIVFSRSSPYSNEEIHGYEDQLPKYVEQEEVQ